MKRTISILLCLVLALSLFAGCQPALWTARLPGDGPGTETEPATETEPVTTVPPRPLTAEEILEAAGNRLQTANSLAAGLEITLSFTMEYDGTAQTQTMQAELSGELMTHPLAFHGSGKVLVQEDEASEELPFELYLFGEEGKLAVYARSDDAASFERITVDLPEDETETVYSPRSGIDWEMETGEDSYLLSHTVTEEEANRFWDSASKEDMEGLENLEELGVDTENLRHVLSGTELRMTVDRESLEYREISIDLSKGVEVFIQELLEQLAGSALGEDDFSLGMTDVRFVLALRLHDYDGVAPFAAPEDYEDLGDLSELMTGLGGNSEFETGPILEELDDGYALGDYAFRLKETTPRDIVEQGWVVTDAVSMGGELGEDGIADPGALVQIYLKQEGREDDAWNPLRLGIVNTGEEPADYLDCPIYFFSVNETPYYEGSEECMVDFIGPGGIEPGMDRAQITELLGEPYFDTGYDEEMSGLYYYSYTGEALALLLDRDGTLQALFYQDNAHYLPTDYVFHD